MHSDELKLQKAGYLTKCFTPYHFQVRTKEDSFTIINIWPTANKILKQFEPGPARRYQNVVSAVQRELERFVYTITPPTPEMEFVMWWRGNPLKRLSTYVEEIQ